MTPITKVAISAAAGSFVASWAEPKVMALLPASFKTATWTTVAHLAVTGLSAGLVYYAIDHVAK